MTLYKTYTDKDGDVRIPVFLIKGMVKYILIVANGRKSEWHSAPLNGPFAVFAKGFFHD